MDSYIRSYFVIDTCCWLLLQDLDRHVENLTKNHKHEMGIERARHKEAQGKLRKLEDTLQHMQDKLRVWSATAAIFWLLYRICCAYNV